MPPAAARPCRALALATLLALAPAAAPAQVQLTPEEMLAVARSAAAVANPAGAERVTLMLDRIEAEHPASDIAGLVRLYRDSGMADGDVVAAITARLAGAAPVPAPAPAPPSAAPGTTAAAPVPGAALPMPPAAPTPPAAAPLAAAPAPALPPAVPPAAGANPFTPAPAPGLPQPGVAAAPPLPPAFEADERALRPDTALRREVQGRLAAIGFDPGGADGRFGPRTRAAIADWQGTQGIYPTGFLGAAQLEALRVQSQATYPAWLAANPPPRAAPARSGGNRSTQSRVPCSVRTTDYLGRRRPECDFR